MGLILILTAAFMVVLDFSIVNVALPSIQRELHFPAAAVEWVVTGFAVAFGGLLILGGRAADLCGRRRLFIAGLLGAPPGPADPDRPAQAAGRAPRVLTDPAARGLQRR
jgi:MFS family permease